MTRSSWPSSLWALEEHLRQISGCGQGARHVRGTCAQLTRDRPWSGCPAARPASPPYGRVWSARRTRLWRALLTVMFTVVCRTPRALVFEPGNELGVYPRVLFEMRTAMCGMLHDLPVAGVAGAWRVFAARWGPVLLSHVSSQCAPVGVVCDSEAVHVICVCIELAPETLCVRLGCGLYCLQTKTCRRRNVSRERVNV